MRAHHVALSPGESAELFLVAAVVAIAPLMIKGSTWGFVMARYIAAVVCLAVITCLAIPFTATSSRLSLHAAEAPSEDVLLVHHASGPGAGDLPGFSPDAIIVKFAPGVSRVQQYSIAQHYACWIDRSCDAGEVQLVGIPGWASPQDMVDIFARDEEVEYAELNHYARLSFVPDDTFYSFQWNLDDPGKGGIRMPQAWEIQQGDPNIIVAILDTGVAYEDFDLYRQAPDLAGTRFVPGYDFINDDSHPNDDHGHGTHVAGTVAQSTNNKLGVAGVAFGCSLMPVKVLDQDGTGDYFTIASGILRTVSRGRSLIFTAPGAKRVGPNRAGSVLTQGARG